MSGKDKSMLQEFKEFAVHGNVVDMAVGIIIGGAFGGIVKSLTDDVIMPPIGLILGKVDFKDMFFSLNGHSYANLAVAKAASAPVLAYGAFINTILNFFIVAFAMFIVIKQMNKLRGPVPEAAPVTTKCDYCLSEIPIGAKKCSHCCSLLS